VPALLEADGSKLAKSRRSVSLDAARAVPQLLAVLSMLGLPAPGVLARAPLPEIWNWAIAHWDIEKVPKGLTRRVSTEKIYD
jgi:glutamyl-Q tRNA(Asp) synthetase